MLVFGNIDISSFVQAIRVAKKFISNAYNYKKFGQHFLYDKNIIQKIILKLQPKHHDYFIEIGPGEGALTNPLIENLKK